MAAKPVHDASVAVAFRCADTITCATGDRVQGDPTGPYVGSRATMLGAFLNPGHGFALRLEPQGGQYLHIDFSQPIGLAPCVAAGTCRRVGGYAFTTVQTFDTTPDSLLTPVDAADNGLPNGLLDIAVNTSRNARFSITFSDPFGRTALWSVRYNPTAYPGSTYVNVRRTSTNAWTVTTTASAAARLVSATGRGNQPEIDEGTFILPFQLAITQR